MSDRVFFPINKQVFIPNKIEMGFFGISYNQIGGAFEEVGERGTSHLMEHLMCKTFDDKRDELKSLGVDYNAYTSDNKVVFWFSGLTESLSEVCDVLYERLTIQPITWSEEAFNNEKSTVLQEYGDTFNNQESGFYYNLLRTHYNYGGAIGYYDDVKNFTYERSLEYAKRFTLPNMIVQVGDTFVNISHAYEEMKVSGKAPKKAVFGTYDNPLETVPKDNKSLVGLLGSKPTDISNASIMGFIMSCINGGLESPLYDEIREKRGLSYYSAGESIILGSDCFPMFFASTSNDNVGKLEKVYDEFFSRKAEDVITEERFNICKKQYKVKQRTCEILPHSGVKSTVLGDVNPFDGIAELSYETLLNKYNELMLRDNYVPVKY